MAKELKGKEECSLIEIADAMWKGIESIMDKAGSKAGDKTISDALILAVRELQKPSNAEDALKKAYIAADEGAKSTRNMRSIHGRAAYFAEKSIGIVDGGAIVGKLIFKALAD